MFANELAELRKMNKMVTQSKLALEQIVLRLNTVTELGEVVMTLAPATSVVRNLRQGLSGIMPEAEGEMSEISGLLSGILVDAGSVSGTSLNFETANEEAELALAEAAAVAEARMRERFPTSPTRARHRATWRRPKPSYPVRRLEALPGAPTEHRRQRQSKTDPRADTAVRPAIYGGLP